VEIWVQGHSLDLVTAEGIQPTVFSLFLANLMRPGSGDRLAIDAGAGGGVLAIALARLGVARTIAVEHLGRACELIAENSRRNGVSGNVEVVEADIVQYDHPGYADMVVSNPPTIPEVNGLPYYALGAGPDGMKFLESLLIKSSRWLHDNGTLQLVLSSLVDTTRFFEICSASGFVPKPLATLLVPFRDFYYQCYPLHTLDLLAASGRIIAEVRDGQKSFSEFITVYSCSRRRSVVV